MSSTTGKYPQKNTAHGENALAVILATLGSSSNKSFDNTAYGQNALNSLRPGNSESTAFGSEALSNNEDGENSAFGAQALALCEGTGNAAFGNWALRYTVNSHKNSAFGYRSMAGDEPQNTIDTDDSAPSTYHDGKRNTAFGYSTMRYSPDGNDNTAIGHNSMRNIRGEYASENTGVGEGSLMNVKGAGSGQGLKNTALGKDAGSIIEEGNSNTFLGYNTNAGGVNEKESVRRTAIGADARSDQDHAIVLGTVKESVGIRTNAPTSVLDVRDGGENRDVIRATTTGTKNAIVATTSSTGDAVRAMVESGAHGVSFVSNGGHVNKVVRVVLYGAVGNSTTIYKATPNDYIIIAGYSDGTNNTTNPGYVELPHPSNLREGHTFIIRNASDQILNIQVSTTPKVFVQFGNDDSSASTVNAITAGSALPVSPVVEPAGIARTFVVLYHNALGHNCYYCIA